VQRFLSVLGFNDLVSGAGEQIAQDAPVVRLILHHQDTLAHRCASPQSTLIGSVKKNVDPFPGADSTQIRPLCISMIRLAMDSPSPVPPFFRVIELSPCWNSSNIRAWSAGLMPGPESRTATVNEPSAADALMAISPLSVNFMALPTRFSSTCAMRRPSPCPT